MRPSYVIAVLILLTAQLSAQPWQVAYPHFTPIPYTGVFGIGDRIYRVGLHNLVEVTTDFGETWTSLTTLDSRYNIQEALAAGDHALGLLKPPPWASGIWEDSTHSSVLLFTKDELRPRLLEVPWFVPVQEFWRRHLDIDISEDALFLTQSFTEQTLMRSTDNGLSWEELPIPDSLPNGYLPRFFDRERGLLMSNRDDFSSSSVFVTHDAGEHWTRTALLLPFRYQGIPAPPVCWLSRDSVLSVDKDNATVMSTDGGVTWRQLNLNLTLPLIRSLEFHRSGRGYIVCEKGKVFRTDDFGIHTVSVRDPVYNTPGSLPTAHVYSPDEDRILLGDSFGVASRSNDAGLSWIDEHLIDYNGPVLQVHSIDTVYARVTALRERTPSTIRFIRTTDGGHSWAECIDMEGRDWFHVHFATSTDWYALRKPTDSDMTAILKTSDAGETWHAVYAVADTQEPSVFARNPGRNSWDGDHVWFIRSDSILATSDGGVSWRMIYPGAGVQSARDIDISDSPNCYVLTRNILYISNDNGETWHTQPDAPRDFSWPRLSVCGDGRVYLYADDNELNVHRLWKSTDAGVTWDTIPAAQLYFLDISYIDENGRGAGMREHGVAQFFSTTDEWRTYRIEQEIYWTGASDIHMIDARNGWASTAAAILKTTSGGINWTNVTPSIPQSPRILSTWPQPVSQGGMMSTEIELTRPGPVRIELYDLLGRRRAVMWDAEVTARRRTVQWSTAGLERGVYVLRMMTSDGVGSRKVVIR